MTRKIFFILFLLALIGNVNAQNLSPLKNVINRVCPWMTGKYILKSIPKENGKDVFELSTQNGKLIIKASNIPSGGMGFNWYLKNYCHRFYSHCGNNLAPVSKLPVLKETIHKISPYPYRYYLNYCTLNYSMSFQGPGEWEKELDWMVLNGINLALMTNGMEKVWLNTLTHFGYSREEALKFIPGPAFNAWWLMGNLEGWGGPVSQSMIDERSKTEQFIVTRMRELNIEPVFQCFYGMVPISLKNHYPKSPIIEQGKWAGDFDRPSILLPGDSLFKEMAAFYYKELKRLYGQAHFFGGEPFHEGGRREGITESDAAHAVYSELIKHNPGSVWVLQGWSGNPSKELLNGLKSDETLVLDLFGEAANYWEKREGYDNHNWAWCTVSNFGEKTGLYGRLERLATEPPRALAGPYGKYMVGIGAMPEGVLNNPVYFDLHYDMGWNEKPVDIQLWIRNYVQYRYGKAPQSALEAWDLLLRSAYKTDETSQEGCAESILCARPSFSIKSVSTWGTAKLYYDPKVTIQALNKLWEASKEIGTVDAYLYDLVDLSRQVLGNQGRELYKEMQEAYATKDLNHFNQAASQFLTILREQDELLSSRKEFLVGNWIAHARKLGKTKADQDLLEKNARAQITYWGPDTNTTTNLHEYAHKEWAGLMKDFYLPRWELFIQESQNALKENRPLKEIDFFTMELKWNQQRNPYPSKPQTNPLKAVQKIITSNTF